VVVLCFVLIVVIPVMGVMYGDLHRAVQEAQYQTDKMKRLRLELLQERRLGQGGQGDN